MIGSVISEGNHLFTRYPILQKITKDILEECVSEQMGNNFQIDYTKSWMDNDFDDLDCVELIMKIEQHVGPIPDEACIELVPYMFISWWRDEKISNIINI